MKAVWIGLALGAALMIQSGLGLVAPEQARVFDPFLLVVVFCGLALGESPGLLVGAAAGWIQDIHFGGSVLGVTALTRLVLGYLVGAAGSRLYLGSPGARILVLFAATVADVWIFEGLSSAFGLELASVSGFDLTVRGATNAFFGTVLFAAVDRRFRQRAPR